MSAASETLFKETFQITGVDAGGKKYFDGVSRLHMTSTENEVLRSRLDVNSDLFKGREGESVIMELVSSISSGAEDKGMPSSEFFERRNIAYAMSGKVFRFSRHPSDPTLVTFYTSFGGLILEVTAPLERLDAFRMDQHVFLLLARPH